MANLNGIASDAMSTLTQFYLDRIGPITESLEFYEILIRRLKAEDITLDEVEIDLGTNRVRLVPRKAATTAQNGKNEEEVSAAHLIDPDLE